MGQELFILYASIFSGIIVGMILGSLLHEFFRMNHWSWLRLSKYADGKYRIENITLFGRDNELVILDSGEIGVAYLLPDSNAFDTKDEGELALKKCLEYRMKEKRKRTRVK